jgi:hypothetical protein
MARVLAVNASRFFGKSLAKELRMLLLPAGGALAAAIAFIALAWLEDIPGTRLQSMDWPPQGIACAMVFCCCVLLVTVVPFAGEFQHRTLGLLLSLPLKRAHMWWNKLTAPALALVLTGLIAGGIALVIRWDCLPLVPTALLFAVPALCSAPFWTLSAGSAIGGAAFTWLGALVPLLVANYVSTKVHLDETVGMGIGVALYSGACLWAGWRKFATLEVREGVAESQPDLLEGVRERYGWLKQVGAWWDAAKKAAWLDRVLRCRTSGSIGNLFRKELRLQKPVYLIATFFAVCWIVVLGFCLLQPGRGYHHMFTAMLALYAPLILLLAGSVSISEEVSFGVSGWHLTLPVPARRQWWIKLLASLGAGAAAGWALPLALSILSSLVLREFSCLAMLHEGGFVVLCISSAFFVLSFWAVALVGNTVRAVLMAILALILLVFCVFAGSWMAGQFSGVREPGLRSYPLLGSFLILSVMALWQSLRAFRRPGAAARVRVVYPGVLVLTALLLGFVGRCL